MRFNISLIFILVSFGLYAQPTLKTDSVNSDSGNPEVVIFKPYESEEDKGHQDNLLKVNLTTILAGNLAVSYEKKVTDKITVEGSAGLTLGTDLSYFLLFQFLENHDMYFNEYIHRNYKVGPSAAASVRYYPNGAPEEFYFAPQVRYRQYHAEAYRVNRAGTFSETAVLIDGKITFGYVDFIEDNIILEYFGGLGFRRKEITMLQYFEYNPQSGSVDELQLNEKISYVPLISAGIKLGFSF